MNEIKTELNVRGYAEVLLKDKYGNVKVHIRENPDGTVTNMDEKEKN